MALEDYTQMTDQEWADFARRFSREPELLKQFFDSFIAWGLRVRRDILAYELFFRLSHGPQWKRFLETLAAMPGEWTLSSDMSASRSADMIEALLRAIAAAQSPGQQWEHGKLGEQADAGDPGDPPMPPQF
jgi:hypothetical protein